MKATMNLRLSVASLLSFLPLISFPFINGLKLTSLINDHPYATLEAQSQQHHDGYGVDASFPAHYSIRPSMFDSTERQQYYIEFMAQCMNRMYPMGFLCEEAELGRMENNLFQPQRMKNYTELGFQKVSTPNKLHESLLKFYQTAVKHEEAWDRHNGPHSSPDSNSITRLNHWEASSQLIDFNTDRGETMRTFIWETTQSSLQKWSGVKLSPSTLYGRVYTNQSVIPPHIDAEPLVISAMIRVVHDLAEPWVMEMIGHDGKAYNISLEEGEMLLYEGASVIHGRPFPMNGVFASASLDVFVHFEPIGHYMNQPPIESDVYFQESLEDLYQQALSKAKGAKELKSSQDLAMHPNYIESGSLESMRWMQTHQRSKLRFALDTTNLNAHTAASAGDLEALMALAANDPASIKKVDENGWTPLHEAVRSDNIEVLKYLIGKGLDMNLRTHDGTGGSPLWWAKKYHEKDSDVVKFLEAMGAKDIAPNE